MREQFVHDGLLSLPLGLTDSEIEAVRGAASRHRWHPRLLVNEALQAVLSTMVLTSSPAHAVTAEVGLSPLGGSWHRDSARVANYALPLHAPAPVKLVIIIAQDAFTDANGATEFIPGSHRGPRIPRDGVILPLPGVRGTPMPACGRRAVMARGDGVAFLGTHVYHRVGVGFGTAPRRKAMIIVRAEWRA
jgi:hypothetical protein